MTKTVTFSITATPEQVAAIVKQGLYSSITMSAAAIVPSAPGVSYLAGANGELSQSEVLTEFLKSRAGQSVTAAELNEALTPVFKKQKWATSPSNAIYSAIANGAAIRRVGQGTFTYRS